ncbi:MAG TPA: alpha/beta hydrolase [Candidatus Saccharimonadales bacterium]|nr:alpha/beta hydrolase [Candidatus Saccharimonadales bacterium]
MSKHKINGFSMNYTVRGEGPDLILVHGLSGDLASWHPSVVGRLAESHRVTVPDLRGHGRSGMPASGYTTRDLASDLTGLMDHLGVHKAHLVGHSFGGAVALHTAVLHPERVAGLVVADARIRSLQKGQGVEQWAHWQRVREWLGRHGVELPEHSADPDLGLLRSLAEARMAGRLDGLTAEPFFIPFSRGGAGRAERWLRLVDKTTAAEDYKAVSGLTPEVIRHVASPVLALYGGLSHCLPTQSELAEVLPDCTTATIKGVGHFHPLAAPDAFVEHVAGFLRRVSRRPEAKPIRAPSEPLPGGEERPRPRVADL